MRNSYGTLHGESVGVLNHPTKVAERSRRRDASGGPTTAGDHSEVRLSRLVLAATVVLLLTFNAVFRLAESAGVHAFRVEMALALAQLLVLGASYRLASVRRFFGYYIRFFCYATAGLFVMIAAANGFEANYAVGLLFIIPGLGAGYGAVTRAARSLGTFFFVTCTGVAVACLTTVGPGASSFLFIASLACISSITLFAAAGWLDARKRYLASEERYRAVFEQASDGIFMLDSRTLDVLDANSAFCRMVGASRSALRDFQVGDFLSRAEGGRLMPKSLAGECYRPIECLVRRSDGTRLVGELNVDRIRHGDGDVLSVVVHDVTSRKEYEERLVKAKEAAEEIARFKSSLLANMSHEIRTPLSSILGWAAVLGREVPDRQRDLVRLIEESGKRLHNTLDSVIELAHLRAKVKQLSRVRFDLNETVRQTTELMRGDAEGKGLALHLRTPDEPIWVKSDPACLRRVLVHVLDNAIKFTETGSVTVSVERSETEPAVIVQDTGVGISRDFIPAVFDEFKQESDGLSRAHEGSGLGLALVRRLTDLLGGRVDVVSERGVGTTFTVYLPDVLGSRRRRCA